MCKSGLELRIRAIKNTQKKYRIDLSIDKEKNLNFICGNKQSRAELYDIIKMGFFLKDKPTEIELELEKEIDHEYIKEIKDIMYCPFDFVFIDDTESEYFPAPESKWCRKFDIFFAEFFTAIPDIARSSMNILNKEFKRDYAVFREFDIAKIDMIDGKFRYPGNMKNSQKIWLFFAMLIFLRQILNYNLPLIINYHIIENLASTDIVDTISLYEFISKYIPQSFIFISDDIFLNLPHRNETERTYVYSKNKKSLYESLKNKNKLGNVYRINKDRIEKYVSN